MRIESQLPVCASDLHLCKMVSAAGNPHPSVNLNGGAVGVLVGGKPWMRLQEIINCLDTPCCIARASTTVWIGTGEGNMPSEQASAPLVSDVGIYGDPHGPLSKGNDVRYVLSH